MQFGPYRFSFVIQILELGRRGALNSHCICVWAGRARGMISRSTAPAASSLSTAGVSRPARLSFMSNRGRDVFGASPRIQRTSDSRAAASPLSR
jgi:hypothetical protein